MASAQDIRILVLSYVSGEISAPEFANRYAPILKAVIKSRDNSVKELALAVHVQVSHYFNGLISENQFRSNLRPLSEEPVNVVIGVLSMNQSVNQYQTVETAFPASSAFFGTSRAKALWSVSKSLA